MNGCSRVFLVLLRLAIGWHLFIEGVDKVDSLFTGPTTTHKAFTSSGYLRESSGPLAWAFRWQAGDLDERALDRLEAVPYKDPEDSKSAHDHMPPELAKDWEDYLLRYLDHYEPFPVPIQDPSADELQAWEAERRKVQEARDELEKKARAKMAHAEVKVVSWLLDLPDDRNVRETTKTYTKATYTVKEPFLERVNAYRDKYREMRRFQDEEFRLFGRDTKHQELTALKVDVARMREELLAEVNAPMRDSLQEILTPQEKNRDSWDALLAERQVRQSPSGKESWIESHLPPSSGDTVSDLADRVVRKDLVPPAPPSPILIWTNWTVAVGLTLAGAGLLLGLLTRPSCLVGAAFLLLFYLASPALPWVPENLKAEGHYLYINKNIIEMLALLALMFLPTGRWFGLDGLLYVLMPWRWRSCKPAPRPSERERVATVLPE
jgi:uncharacterized membrane protein YphA (DoxX/SURF4 family)